MDLKLLRAATSIKSETYGREPDHELIDGFFVRDDVDHCRDDCAAQCHARLGSNRLIGQAGIVSRLVSSSGIRPNLKNSMNNLVQSR
ncbi:hypothetical protein [Tateyamaria omphalii]|uniref:hypothetical protein n=1 Tax=Tateyamaria omphalii TaxID=299262 RepID=UPI001672A7E0|nr:hypothetical protein [Tateyamaria omphalii]